MFSHVTVLGYIGRQIDARTTPQQQVVANTSIQVSRGWQDGAGNDQEEISYIEIEGYGKIGENMVRNGTKGRFTLVTGRLRQQRWTDDKGKHSRVKIIVEMIRFLDAPPQFVAEE